MFISRKMLTILRNWKKQFKQLRTRQLIWIADMLCSTSIWWCLILLDQEEFTILNLKSINSMWARRWLRQNSLRLFIYSLNQTSSTTWVLRRLQTCLSIMGTFTSTRTLIKVVSLSFSTSMAIRFLTRHQRASSKWLWKTKNSE